MQSLELSLQLIETLKQFALGFIEGWCGVGCRNADRRRGAASGWRCRSMCGFGGSGHPGEISLHESTVARPQTVCFGLCHCEILTCFAFIFGHAFTIEMTFSDFDQSVEGTCIARLQQEFHSIFGVGRRADTIAVKHT